MLDLDLLALRNPERFEQMCFRLARYEFPNTIPIAYSTLDGGRDAISFVEYRRKKPRAIVFQSKFVPHPSRAKWKIQRSLDALRETPNPIERWILCLPVDPTGVFHDWLAQEARKRKLRFEIWGRTELLLRLEQHPDVVERFFYALHAELSRYFRSASLELFRIELHSACQWEQPDPKVLSFVPKGNVVSPDLVFDVIVRNTGLVATAITALIAEVFDWRRARATT